MGKAKLALLTLTHVFILSRLIFLPYPELFVYPYLTNRGLTPYKDIFDQHFPGLMFFPINLGTLGMTTPLVARYWQYGVVILTHVILYLVARKLFGEKKAIIANLFYLLWHPYLEGWVLWIDSFMPLFLLPAYYFINSFFTTKKEMLKPRYLLLSGLFLGIALTFKQVMLPLAVLIGGYLLWKTRSLKYALIFTFSALIPVSIMLLYIWNLGIWEDFFFWTVTFNLGTFSEMGRKYPTLGDLIRLTVIFGIPLLFSVKAYIRKKSDGILLLFLFLAGSLVFAYARFDPVHLQPALPFVALLGVFAVMKTPKYLLRALLIIYLVVTMGLLFRFFRGHIGSRVLFFTPHETELVEVIEANSKPEDKIFAFATTPHIYQMADRLPSGNIFVFPFPWFLLEAEQRLLEGLKNDPPKVVIREKNAFVEGRVLVKYAPLVDNYINDNYQILKMVGSVEVMVQK